MNSQLPFLTDSEALEIVKPLTQSAAINRWFKQNGFDKIKTKPNGMPLIRRAYFDEVMGALCKEQLGRFPSDKEKVFSDMTFTMLLRRLGHEFTVHGFRFTFRDWAEPHIKTTTQLCLLSAHP
jgi:hypothetical protein